MKRDSLLERITIDTEVMAGKPVIRGLRITIEHILKAFAGGLNVEELLEEYPELEKEDIQAALIYASDLVNEEWVFAVR